MRLRQLSVRVRRWRVSNIDNVPGGILVPICREAGLVLVAIIGLITACASRETFCTSSPDSDATQHLLSRWSITGAQEIIQTWPVPRTWVSRSTPDTVSFTFGAPGPTNVCADLFFFRVTNRATALASVNFARKVPTSNGAVSIAQHLWSQIVPGQNLAAFLNEKALQREGQLFEHSQIQTIGDAHLIAEASIEHTGDYFIVRVSVATATNELRQ
jgi:hypothetical protein